MDRVVFVAARHADTVGTERLDTAVSYAGWHIVLSYLTSLVGCITTLELLQRRTSTKGAYNWYVKTQPPYQFISLYLMKV